jgi:uncharacterized protein YoxC
MLVENGFSEEQANVFCDLIPKYSDGIGQKFLFRNVQSTMFKVNQVSDSLDKAWTSINQLADLLTKSSKQKPSYIR